MQEESRTFDAFRTSSVCPNSCFLGPTLSALASSKAKMSLHRYCLMLAACLAVGAAMAHAQVSASATAPCGENVAAAEVPRDSLDLPALPKAEVSLIGGTVIRVDPIRDRIILRAFGGRDFTVDFDVRTCIVRGDVPASLHDIRPGTRLYADTILNNQRIFAKALRIPTSPALGETQGQVTGYDSVEGLLRVRDAISARAFNVRVTRETEIREMGQPAETPGLMSGDLVKVVFRSAGEGTNLAEKIDILAQPGKEFTFVGKILAIDLRNGYLTLSEQTRQNTFDVGLDSLSGNLRAELKEGMDVLVHARFDGTKYQALTVEPQLTLHP
jgi:hypothetical protein